MRIHTAMLVSVATLGLAAPAIAQDAAAPSYACVLFEECQTQAAVEQPAEAEATPAAEPTRGRISATRGMSMSGNRSRQVVESSATASGSSATTSRRVTGPSTVNSQQRRTRVASVAPKRIMSRAEQATVLSQGMTFNVGSAVLTPSAKAQALQLSSQMLRADKLNTRFAIEGHTDATGGRELNLDLSRRRAEAIAAFLSAQGVDSGRLDIVGYGYDKPLAGLSATSPRNRRVEVNPLR